MGMALPPIPSSSKVHCPAWQMHHRASRLTKTPMTLSIDIDPAGLLEEGMLVRGEIHLIDLDGGRTVILPVTLTAEDEISGWTFFINQKSRSVCVSCWSDCPCCWPRRPGRDTATAPQDGESPGDADVRMDPWGRPLDVHADLAQADQEAHVEPPTNDR